MTDLFNHFALAGALALLPTTVSAQVAGTSSKVEATTTAAQPVQQRAATQDGERVRDDERARALVRIGEDGIARENDAALNAYFAKNFVFHGPNGDLNFEQLKANFKAMRAAFSQFEVKREAIIVKGDMVAARTVMTGIFTKPFTVAPYGTLAPTGKPMKLEITNIFRFDENGKLAEEWVQSDQIGYLRQLGVTLKRAP